MNVKETFLKLTEYTIPHGQEYTLEKYLPKNIQEDGCGNYFIKIGDNSQTIFTCHMDTACWKYEKVKHVIKGNIIGTDGSTVLSGDDKNGMTILLYMIEKNVPGTYYFFQGEESGMDGARKIIARNRPFFEAYKRMVSFDRRAYRSVITHQMGRRGCSHEFATALSQELTDLGLPYAPDSTGIYTDSASFIGIIRNATNLSVGYFNEHSRNETTDISFLAKLSSIACKVDWENLPDGEKFSNKSSYYFDEYDNYDNDGSRKFDNNRRSLRIRDYLNDEDGSWYW